MVRVHPFPIKMGEYLDFLVNELLMDKVEEIVDLVKNLTKDVYEVLASWEGVADWVQRGPWLLQEISVDEGFLKIFQVLLECLPIIKLIIIELDTHYFPPWVRAEIRRRCCVYLYKIFFSWTCFRYICMLCFSGLVGYQLKAMQLDQLQIIGMLKVYYLDLHAGIASNPALVEQLNKIDIEYPYYYVQILDLHYVYNLPWESAELVCRYYDYINVDFGTLTEIPKPPEPESLAIAYENRKLRTMCIVYGVFMAFLFTIAKGPNTPGPDSPFANISDFFFYDIMQQYN